MRLMSDQYIEKAFLYVLILSLLAHVGIFSLIAFFPENKQIAREEPVMVELEEMPKPESPGVTAKKDVRRHDEKRRRVSREVAPKGEMPHDRIPPLRARVNPAPAKPHQMDAERRVSQESGNQPEMTAPTGKDLLKRKENLPKLTQFFPDAGKMARLEENYRKK